MTRRSSPRWRRSAPRRLPLAAAARRHAVRFGRSSAAARRILLPPPALRGGADDPPLPPMLPRALSDSRRSAGAAASEADGSGDFESGRSDSDSRSGPINPAVATLRVAASLRLGDSAARRGGGATSAAATPMIWETSGDPPRIPRRKEIPRTPARTTLGTPRSGRLGDEPRGPPLAALVRSRVRFQPAEGVSRSAAFAARLPRRGRRRAKRRAAGRTARTARWTRTMTMGATGATLRADP